LDSRDVRVGGGKAVVDAVIIIVRFHISVVARVVIVGIIIVGVVGKVIPGIEPVIETYPSPTIPSPPVAIEKVSAAMVPIVMPAAVMSCKDVILCTLCRLSVGVRDS